jgi:prevent-host-death family protein
MHEHSFVLDSNRKGAIAEAAIALEAIKHGIDVYQPISEHGRFDLIFGFPSGHLARVQCKWASRLDEVIRVYTVSSRRGPNGFITATYTADDVDAIAAYCGDLDRCYYVPIEIAAGQYQLQLRLAPPKNRQRASIHFASKYELGAIAQLGERRAGSAKGVGSSPTGSTASNRCDRDVGADEFRNQFGYYMGRAAAGEEILIRRRGKPHARLGPPISSSQQALELAA